MNKIRFNEDNCYYNNQQNLICHYTNKQGLFAILRSMKLKVSSFANLNDINEMNIKNYCCDDSIRRCFAATYIENNCGIISFTKSFKYKDKDYSFCGALKPSMWAYYADNMKGACIVINQDRFLENNKQYLEQHFYKFEDVEYGFFNAYGKFHIEDRAKDTITKNYRKLFFIKHYDWQQENEKRLFIIDDNIVKGVFLDICECIEFIVLGRSFVNDKGDRNDLSKLMSDESTACFSKIDKESFAFITSAEYGYYLQPYRAYHLKQRKHN